MQSKLYSVVFVFLSGTLFAFNTPAGSIADSMPLKAQAVQEVTSIVVEKVEEIHFQYSIDYKVPLFILGYKAGHVFPVMFPLFALFSIASAFLPILVEPENAFYS